MEAPVDSEKIEVALINAHLSSTFVKPGRELHVLHSSIFFMPSPIFLQATSISATFSFDF